MPSTTPVLRSHVLSGACTLEAIGFNNVTRSLKTAEKPGSLPFLRKRLGRISYGVWCHTFDSARYSPACRLEVGAEGQGRPTSPVHRGRLEFRLFSIYGLSVHQLALRPTALAGCSIPRDSQFRGSILATNVRNENET